VRLQLYNYWDRISSSFWFVPGSMAGAAVALAFISVNVDEPVTEWLELTMDWKFSGGAEGASAVLGIVAGSMITIAGVVFSMTLVTLSLASSQLGPRLLRTFMRDNSTQVVLGTFIATFVYCLLVLRTIRHGEDATFVPQLSVNLGVALAVASVGVLIYFIHHVSVSIQANEIAARIGRELMERIDQHFPERTGQEGPRIPRDTPDVGFIEIFDREARTVAADGGGYIQFIDRDALLELASKENLVIRLERKNGNFIVAGSPLVSIWPGSRVTDQIAMRVQSHLVMGHQRTSQQDIEFGINQLVEMAVRALSTGLNDPFTAIACVDQLGSVLCRLAEREMPSPFCYDHQNKLRLISSTDSFEELVDASFNQIRQNSRSSAAVTIRLLETIAVITGFVHRPEDRATLLRHAEMIARGAREGLPEEEDRRMVQECWQAVVQSCSKTTGDRH